MKKNGLYRKLLDTAVAPVVLLGLIIMGFCYFRFTNTIYEETRNNMRDTAETVMLTYDAAYPGDYTLVKSAGETYDLYKGERNITTEYSIVDNFAGATSTEISLLYLDVRIHTTFVSDSGTRLAGISTNSETSDLVLNKGQEVFYKNITILNDSYLVLYVPVRNSDDSVVGMIEIAKKQHSLRMSVLKAVWPILLLVLLGVLLAAFTAYRSTKNITDDIKVLQQFLNKVASGSLSVDLDRRLVKRNDEIGDISKSSLAMQKSIRGFIGTDPLTGLNNRRYVMEALEKIRERASSTGEPFSLSIGDIDFFKKVNDTYGHNAGDEVLKAVAGILKESMVGKGFAARWGGEEFIMVFDRYSSLQAKTVLEETLDRIRAAVVQTEGFDIKVTMTFGVSDGSMASIEEIVNDADEKLYYGKQNGRNRIIIDLPEEAKTPEAQA